MIALFLLQLLRPEFYWCGGAEEFSLQPGHLVSHVDSLILSNDEKLASVLSRLFIALDLFRVAHCYFFYFSCVKFWSSSARTDEFVIKSRQ